jgi:hypothetical protein
MEVTLKMILQAINENAQELNQRIDNLEIRMDSRFDELEKKVDGKTTELSETQETLHWVATKTLRHEQKIKLLQQQQ